jgi:hypothetical protein
MTTFKVGDQVTLKGDGSIHIGHVVELFEGRYMLKTLYGVDWIKPVPSWWFYEAEELLIIT